jgi:outer membrane protein assembly factor BamB
MWKRSSFVVALLAGLLACELHADDWLQYRGPNRDGVSHETGLLQQWPQGGPRLLWTYENAGVGYSGPAIVGDRLYMAGGRGDAEFVFALDLKTAAGQTPKEVWSAKLGPLFTWKGNNWNAGPNATPTLSGDLLFALGGGGDLVCVEPDTGKVRWRKHLPRELGGEVNPIGGGSEDPTPLGWGYAAAPLVDGDQLICVPGGKQGLLAALDKHTGKLLWQSKEVTDQASYSSPIPVEVGGVRQYIQATNSGIVGVAAKDGKLLWRYVREPAYDDVVIATPIFHDNHVFTSVGFGQGCDLIKLVPSGGEIKVAKILSDKSIQNRDGGMVRVGDHLYGHTENHGWICAEFKTGRIIWEEKTKLGRGSVTCADGRLYGCSEKEGVVVLLEPTPAGWREKGRLQLPKPSRQRKPSGGLWTHPAVANGKLYIRDQELLFCFDVSRGENLTPRPPSLPGKGEKNRNTFFLPSPLRGEAGGGVPPHNTPNPHARQARCCLRRQTTRAAFNWIDRSRPRL